MHLIRIVRNEDKSIKDTLDGSNNCMKRGNYCIDTGAESEVSLNVYLVGIKTATPANIFK